MIQALASWSHVVDHIWKLNIQAALLAAIVAIVCLMGRQWLTPGWRSILWMLVFLRLVIPIGPSSTFSLGNVVSASFAPRSADGNTWTKVAIDARNLKEHEQVEIWMTPERAHEKFPELSIAWVGRSDRPVIVKLPRGWGRAAYWSKVDDRWDDTEIRHPIQITADGPTMITLAPSP